MREASVVIAVFALLGWLTCAEAQGGTTRTDVRRKRITTGETQWDLSLTTSPFVQKMTLGSTSFTRKGRLLEVRAFRVPDPDSTVAPVGRLVWRMFHPSWPGKIVLGATWRADFLAGSAGHKVLLALSDGTFFHVCEMNLDTTVESTPEEVIIKDTSRLKSANAESLPIAPAGWICDAVGGRIDGIEMERNGDELIASIVGRGQRAKKRFAYSPAERKWRELPAKRSWVVFTDGQDVQTVFKKKVPEGLLVGVVETRDCKTVSAGTPGDEGSRVPEALRDGYVLRTYKLVLPCQEGKDETVLWRKELRLPQKTGGGLWDRLCSARLLDAVTQGQVGHLLVVYLGCVYLEPFALAGPQPTRRKPVMLFRESEGTGRTVQAGRIAVDGNALLVTLDTLVGNRETWRVSGDRATLERKSAIPREARTTPRAVPRAAQAADPQQQEARKRLADAAARLMIADHPSTGLKQEVLSSLKEGPGGILTDDLALVLLTSTAKSDGADVLIDAYRTCAPRLRRLKLEGTTKAIWRQYAELMQVEHELLGGDPLLGVLARYKVLEELREHAHRLHASEGSDAEAQKIEEFVRAEAKKLIRDLPRADLNAMLRELARETR